jgi:hypothetical protein
MVSTLHLEIQMAQSKIGRINIHDASVSDLRSALKAAKAYTGCARFAAHEMRTYAARVQLLRSQGVVSPLTTKNIDEVENGHNITTDDAPTPDTEEAVAAKDTEGVSEEATEDPAVDAALKRVVGLIGSAKAAQKEETRLRREKEDMARNVATRKMALFVKLLDNRDEVTLDAEAFLGAGLGARWAKWGKGWAPGFPMGKAAASLGYEVLSVNKGVITLRKAA